MQKTIAAALDLPDSEQVVCGMSLGHADPAPPESRLVTEREPVAAEIFPTVWSPIAFGRSVLRGPPRERLRVGDLVNCNLWLGRHQLQQAARELVQVGLGEVTVVAHDGRTPTKGARVTVKGKVNDFATFGGQSLGLHLEQEHLKFKY